MPVFVYKIFDMRIGFGKGLWKGAAYAKVLPATVKVVENIDISAFTPQSV